jgi:hypothetical protein
MSPSPIAAASNKSPREIGNRLHSVILALIVIQTGLSVYELSLSRDAHDKVNLADTTKTAPRRLVLDPAWIETGGFCVANPTSRSLNSHDVCVYVDVVMETACLVLYLALRKGRGMENLDTIYNYNIPGLFLQALGHVDLANTFRARFLDSDEAVVHKFDLTPSEYYNTGWLPLFGWQTLAGLAFWAAFLKAAMFNVDTGKILFMVLPVTYAQLFIPMKYSFTYSQTVLLLAFSLNQLSRPVEEKDWSYASHPIFIGLPVLALSWFESLACQSIVRDYLYGHVAYDVYIPVATMAWYYWNYQRNKSDAGAGDEVVLSQKQQQQPNQQAKVEAKKEL